jgi:hypothetical protein
MLVCRGNADELSLQSVNICALSGMVEVGRDEGAGSAQAAILPKALPIGQNCLRDGLRADIEDVA